MRRRRLAAIDYIEGVRAGNRATLGRAITLMESRNPHHQEMAREVLTALMPHTGNAHRVGITGVPGVGKSTFIETLGTNLTSADHKVAVLAVDPTSVRSGGSILGDKTRMESLSRDPNAFIRPSPTSGTLGGVASKTREAMLLCEAAGYDVILIETVGVGQSELIVAQMTDFFLVLMLAGAGDELQGIKRGLMELADTLVVNKADGDNALPAQGAARTLKNALRYLTPSDAPWKPRVLTASALHNQGLDKVWSVLQEHRAQSQQNGAWQNRRQKQQIQWLWAMVDEELRTNLTRHHAVQKSLPSLKDQVLRGQLAPTTAAHQIVSLFLGQ